MAAGKFLAGTDVFITAVATEGVKRTKDWGAEQWNKAMDLGESACDAVDRWGGKTAERINNAADRLETRVRETANSALTRATALAERAGNVAVNVAETAIKAGAGVENRVANIAIGPRAFVTELRADFDQARADLAQSRVDRAEQTASRRLQEIGALAKGGSKQVEERAAAAREKAEQRFLSSTEKHEAARDAARAQAEILNKKAAQLREKQTTWGIFRRALANL